MDSDSRSGIQSTDMRAIISRLHVEGNLTNAEMTELLKQLHESRQPSSANQSAIDLPLIQILREKERCLRTELELARRTDPQFLPIDPQMLGKDGLAGFQRQVSQMKETGLLVESQRLELLTSIQQERRYHEQLFAVNEKLQEKCSSLETENPPQDAVETVTQELENKIIAAAKIEEAMMKRLAGFAEEHFPLPEPAQVAKTSKGLRSQKQQRNKKALPLKDILLELMTKCVESPNSPYLALDERHWPAHIELLLRCNIVLQHPDDDRRIKLVPFHL